MAELKQEIISRPKRKRIPNRTIFNEDNLTECSGNLDDEGEVTSVKCPTSNSGEDNSSSGCVDIAELKREAISRPKRKRISNRTIFNEDNLTECPGNLQDEGCQESSVKSLISNSGEDNSTSSSPGSSRNDIINAWLPKCKDNFTNSLQRNPLVNQREDNSYSPPPFTSIPDEDLLPVSCDLINSFDQRYSFDQIENVIPNNRVVKEDYEEIPHPCEDHKESSLDKSPSENNVAVGASNNVAYSNRNATSFDSSHPKNLLIANSNSGNATNLNCADFQGLHMSNHNLHFEKSPSENNVITGGSSNVANSNRAATSTKNLQITNSNSGNATNLNFIHVDSTSNFQPNFDKNPQCPKYFAGSLNNNEGNSKRSATTTEQMSISKPVPSNAPQYDLQLMSKPVLIDKEKMDALGIRLLSSNVTSCQESPAMLLYAQTISNANIASGNNSNATSGHGNKNVAFNLGGNTGSSLESNSCVGLQVVSNNEETIFVEPETIFAVLNMSNKVLDNGTTSFSANQKSSFSANQISSFSANQISSFSANQKSSFNLDNVEPVNMGMFDFCNNVKYKVVHTNNRNIISPPENQQNGTKKVTLDKRFESFKPQCSVTGQRDSESSRTKRSLCGSSLEKQVNLAFPKGQGYRLDLSTRRPVSSASGKTWWPSCPPKEDKSSSSPTNSSPTIPVTAPGLSGNKNVTAGNDCLSSTGQSENEASTSGKTWWPSCPPKDDKSSRSSPTNSSPKIPCTAQTPSGNKNVTAGNDGLPLTGQPQNSPSTPGTPGISIEDKHSKLPPDGSQMIPDATRCPSRSKNDIAGIASSAIGQPEKSASVLTCRPALSPNRDSCSNMPARNSENVQDTILAPLSTNLNNSSGTDTVTKGSDDHLLSEYSGCEQLFRNQKFTSCTKSVFRSDGITDAKPTLQKESTKPMAAEAPQKPTSRKVPPLRLHRRYCKDCQLDLETFVAFENHMRTVHGMSEVRAYECEICSKTFTRSDHLRTHQVVHTNKKPFGCNICGRRFRSLTSRNYHLLVHADSRPFRCTVEGCGSKFRAKNALLKHLLHKHGIIQS